MKIINMKCPNCDASIEVNSELGNIKCNYCGSNIYIQDENETKTERVIKALGNEAQKMRDYYSSSEYQKKLEINRENTNKNIKMIIGIIALYILFIICMIILVKLV